MSTKPHHDRAAGPPTFHECPACCFLSPDPAFVDPATTCRSCGATGGERRVYPARRLRRLDARVREYHAAAEHEIVVILVAAFLEAVLEDIIDRLLLVRGADIEVRRLLLDGNRAIGARVMRIFPQLTHEDFEEVASELGFREFPKRWHQLRDARNAFIHDSPFHGPQESIDAHLGDEAMALLDQAYDLFVLINNKFVSDSRQGRPIPG
jgi:hypothetical protein